MARSVADCALLLQIVVGSTLATSASLAPNAAVLKGVRLGIPRGHFWDNLDAEVAQLCEAVLGRLRAAGAILIEADVPNAGALDNAAGFPIALYETVSVSGPLLIAGLVMQGVARSALTTVLVLTLLELRGVGESRAGAVSGMFFSVAEIGGDLGPVSLGLLYDATGNFHAALAVLSGVALLLAIGTMSLTRLARGPVSPFRG